MHIDLDQYSHVPFPFSQSAYVRWEDAGKLESANRKYLHLMLGNLFLGKDRVQLVQSHGVWADFWGVAEKVEDRYQWKIPDQMLFQKKKKYLMQPPTRLGFLGGVPQTFMHSSMHDWLDGHHLHKVDPEHFYLLKKDFYLRANMLGKGDPGYLVQLDHHDLKNGMRPINEQLTEPVAICVAFQYGNAVAYQPWK